MNAAPSKYILLCLAILELTTTSFGQGSSEITRCLGTTSGFSVGEDRMDHLNKMIKRYLNCTVVYGNLEITGLESPDIDASFLKDIEVVTGYVLIALNYIPYLPLEKLRIIRGQKLYGPNSYALHIAVNYNREIPVQGLQQLGLKSLSEIQRGNISIIQNNRMCFADTIDWYDILNPKERRRNGWTVTIDNNIDPSLTTCKKCDTACKGGCWGEGPDMCQILTNTICHSVCGDARCRGPGADDCCDSECASGCNGPTDRDCKGCLHVNNNGVCQLNCPPQYIYDQETSRNVPNPDFKYHFNDQCVDKCPSNMLVEENGCVKHCRKGRHNNGSGVCVRCNGNECNKECFGVGSPDGPLSDNDTVDSKNVHHFEGCNIVRGNVVFQAYAFVGDVHTGTPPMKADQIMKAFSGVKVITGYLKILSWPTEFTDFSVFSNLTTIMGVDLFRDAVSFLIQDSITEHGPFHLSHVERLGFRSLKSIKYGNVYIGYMKKMCYQKKVNWTTIIQNPIIHRSFRNGLLLRANEGNCINVSCHAACSSNGCWGPGANECLDCKKLTYKGECRLECDKKLGIYQEGNVCKPCDSECKRTCDGSGPENCTSCAHYVNVAKCVPTCPPWKYPDPVTKKCLLCHKNCMQMKVSGGNTLCSGPNSTLGPGGCEFCNMVVTDSDLKYRECLPIDQVTCPDAHFQSKSSGLVAAIRACVPCVKGCKNCTGSTDKDCLHALLNKPVTIVIIAVVVAITVLGLVGFILFLVYHKRKTSKKKRQMSMRALGLEASPEPMTPSGVAPNQAQLRIVKETELKIGKILGSGAFGTVHKGFWVPDLAPREKVKVPVAIKVLRDESSQVASNEILDEAFVMASCEHPNLVRLLGISLSQRITLITQLMPLGNLLEYVRDNKDNIGSQNILNWCLQIAKGMCYLAEEKHLVHRDLAARNVLVKSPNHVRITDFGLAKLLDVNEDVYRAEGGKMPIKWLALESIQHRIFTQKSDVWSFGVTVWELMTFGKKPYENVPAREVHTLLEKGERLLQPTICTIDVYMLMIKCWTVDADARPTFRELVEEFSKMARDPSRYLVIHNDGQLAELPSPTPTEFFRSLKYEENDDFFIRDAEDYLHTNPEEFAPATPGRGNRFPLQPAPVKAQWRKQQQNSVLSTNSRQHLLGGRIHSSSLSSSTAGDSRHDSAVTMMTGLPSESGAYPPNGCSTPFSVSTPGSAMTPGQLTANGEFAAFARSSGRISRDQMPGTSGLGKMQPSSLCPRTQSESSDVFLSTPSFQNPKDSVWDSVDEHPGLVRAREDSATMRYSDEPILFPRQESRPNGIITGKETLLGGFKEDEEGYLAPTAAAKSKPEYLDPTTFQQSHFVLKPNGTDFFSGTQNMSHCVAASIHPSVMTNPEYEPTFTPFAQEENMFAAGSHNLLCSQRSIPTTDEAGYEIPLGSQTNSLRPPSPQYENVGHSDDFRNIQAGDGSQDDHRILSRSRGSQSGESTSSEKRDSGLQSEGEEEIPLKAKNLKVGGGDTAKSSSQSADANHNYAKQQNPNENSVDNPNYELLENMTDGGFQPMSEFIPSEESNTNPAVQFRLPSQSEYSSVILPNFPGRGASQYGMRSSPPSKDRKNHLKLTINCESSGCDEDPDDDIFVTPESKRRFATNVHDNSRAEDEKGVSRTYSEPDSGVGIEMAMDNILYHRLGSSGWEGSD